MEPTAAHRKLGTARFLDVRKSHEYDAGHIEGAEWVTLRELPNRIDELDTGQVIVVTCQIGQRSGLAAEFLRERGFDADNLEGGVEAWVRAGLPLVSSDGRRGRVIDGWAETLK
jgi:rhodanese-related sulfurtransferase